MNSIKMTLCAITLVSVLAVHPQKSDASDGFTGVEFLKWSVGEQRSFVNNSLTMAIYVVSQSDKAYGECVTNWYNAQKAAGFPDVRNTVAKHDNRNPQLVMLAMVARECGPIDFSAKG